MYHNDSSVGELLGWFLILAIVNSAAVNIGVQTPLLCADLDSFRYIPTSEIAISSESSIFSFLMNEFNFYLHKLKLYKRVSL
jgi:hypothetical protein